MRDNKSGLDSAHKIAFEYAKKNNFNYLITMDADFSHDPMELGNFVKFSFKFICTWLKIC